MSSKQYPFIDVAVLEKVRSRFAAGEALVLFSDDMDKVLWANGAGASLFNHEFIYDFLDAGLPVSDVTTRQIKATTGQLANLGDKRSFLMRMTTNFQRVTIQATVEMIPDRTGDRVVLFSAPVTEKPLPLAQRARLMLSGFDDPDTHMAVLDADGSVLAASAGFQNLGMTPDTTRALVRAVSRDADQLLKRPVPTGRGYLPAAIGQLSEDPSLNLLFCVETAIGQMDPTNDDTFMPIQAPSSTQAIPEPIVPTSPEVHGAVTTHVDFDDALDAVAHIEDNAEEPVEAEDIVEARSNVTFDMPVKDDMSIASMLQLLDGATDDDMSLSYADEASSDMADLSAMNVSDAFLNPPAFVQAEVESPVSDEPTPALDNLPVDDANQTDVASEVSADVPPADVSNVPLSGTTNSELFEIAGPVDQTIADDAYWAPVPEIADTHQADHSEIAAQVIAEPVVDQAFAGPELTGIDGRVADAADIVSEDTGNARLVSDPLDDTNTDITDVHEGTADMVVEMTPEAIVMGGTIETSPDVTPVASNSVGTSPDVAVVSKVVPDMAEPPLTAKAKPFEYQRNARPVRFVWKVDAQGKFSEISEEFAQAVGPNAAAINDMQFSDVAAAFKMDPEGKIGELLQKRDTWSGKTIFWPIENTSLRVPVDLAALPTYSRSRSFDGFRGFGIVRLADAVDDPDQIGLSLGQARKLLIETHTTDQPHGDMSQVELLPDTGSSAAIELENTEQAIPVEADDLAGVTEVEDTSAAANGHQDLGEPTIETSSLQRVDTPSDYADQPVIYSDETAADALEASATETTENPGGVSKEDDGVDQADPLSGDHTELHQDAVSGNQKDEDPDVNVIASDVEQSGDHSEIIDTSAADTATTSIDQMELTADTKSDVTDEDEDFRGERPALRLVDNPGRRHSDKVVNLEAHRGKSREGLSLAEQAAFNEIARQLDPFGKRILNDVPKTEAPVTEARLPSAPDNGSGTEQPAKSGAEARLPGSPVDQSAGQEPAAPLAAPPNISTLIPSRTNSEEQLTAKFVDALPLAILVHTGEKLIHGNPEFFRLTGYESLKQLQDYGGIDALLEQDQSPRDGDEAPGMMLVTEAGTLEPVTARLQSVRWDDSNALLLALVPQRTDAVRKQALAAMADASQSPEDQIKALTVEVEELRSILETATDGVVIVGQDGDIRSMNKSASALFNFDDEDTRGKSFAMLFAHESQKAVMDYLSGLAGHGVASVLNDGREVIGREASGGFIPLFMTMGRLSSSNGYCAVIRDITQWKRTEEELRTAKRAAETANAHKSEFLARVSHEIRTPLNAIIGFSDMMATERLGPIGHPRYVEYSDDIGRSGRHVLDIVNDLLDISKIEAGEMELDFTSVELNETISEAVSLVQPQVNSQRVIIRTSLSQSVPNIVADQRSIKQIAINILANAIRYTPAGGQIVVSTAYEANGSVVLRIRDTGVGMTRAELEQALKPFRQVTTGSRKRGDGTGLGLPLTKAMVDANRANFAISSAPNEGTLVEITFPSQRVLAN